MKDEVGSCGAGLFVNGCEDGGQFVALLDEFRKERRLDESLVRRNKSAFF